jgi:hypothetical protein
MHGDRGTRNQSTVWRPWDTPTSYQPVSGRNKHGVAGGTETEDKMFESIGTRICRSWHVKVRQNVSTCSVRAQPIESPAVAQIVRQQEADIDCCTAYAVGKGVVFVYFRTANKRKDGYKDFSNVSD